MTKGKDPAVLWYWADWNGGTVTLSRHLKGCYMDLLYAQFTSGPLSLEEIKTVLGNDFANWGALSKKFKKAEDTSLFFNEKLDSEIKKRKAFSEKQKLNVSKRYQNATKPLTNLLPLENENANEIVPGTKSTKGVPVLPGEKHFEHMLEFYAKQYHEHLPGFREKYSEKDYREFAGILKNLLKDVPKLKTLFDNCMNISEWLTDMERQPYARILLAAQKVTGSKLPDRQTGMANRIFMFIPDEFKKASRIMIG